MGAIRYIFLVATLVYAVAQAGCFSEYVRLYVEVDESCETCCVDQQFAVYVGGIEEGVIAAGEEIVIERMNGTGNEALEVIIADGDGVTESSRRTCQQCIASKISDDNYSDDYGLLYALYDDDVQFSDQDLDRTIRCE